MQSVLPYLLPIIYFGYLFYKAYKHVNAPAKASFVQHYGELDFKYKETLEKYFTYYQKLDPTEKKEFERRVMNFIRNKKFVPMHGMKGVPAEIKAFIAGAAVQLTFGMDEIYFVHFTTILVFPKEYYSMATNSKHKGGVHEEGVIALSWKDLATGFINDTDSYNVGLHEMAHALSLENRIKNQEYRFLDEENLKIWGKLADREFLAINAGKPTFLRKYATSNRAEFFPVCVEYFFEKPEIFKEKSPNLYNALAALLNQDPLQRQNMNTEPV